MKIHIRNFFAETPPPIFNHFCTQIGKKELPSSIIPSCFTLSTRQVWMGYPFFLILSSRGSSSPKCWMRILLSWSGGCSVLRGSSFTRTPGMRSTLLHGPGEEVAWWCSDPHVCTRLAIVWQSLLSLVRSLGENSDLKMETNSLSVYILFQSQLKVLMGWVCPAPGQTWVRGVYQDSIF